MSQRRPGLWLLGMMLVMGCNPWPRFDDLEPVPQDARLGSKLWEGSRYRSTYIRGSVKGGAPWVFIRERAGLDHGWASQPDEATLLRLNPRSLEIAERTEPPGVATDGLAFGLTLDPALLVISRDGQQPLGGVYRDGAWSTFALPDDFDDAQGDTLVAQSTSRIVQARGGGGIVLRDRRAWIALAPPDGVGQELRLVAWEGDALRVLYRDGDVVCTTLYDYATAEETGPRACLEHLSVSSLAPSSINGSVDRFQAAVVRSGEATGSLQLLSFEGGALTRGARAEGEGLLSNPGSDRSVLKVASGAYGTYSTPSLVAVEGGVVSGPALTSFGASLDCACSRDEDPGCECHARPFIMGTYTDSAGEAALCLILDDFDGGRSIYARLLPLPQVEDPFRAEPCDPACGAGEACILDETGAVHLCQPVLTAPPEAALDSTLAVTVETADPADQGQISLTTSPASEEVDPGPDFTLRVASYTEYVVTVGGDDHPPLTLVSGTLGPYERVDLGRYVLSPGPRVKILSAAAMDDLAVAILPSSHAMILAAEGQWVHVGGVDQLPIMNVTPLGVAPEPWARDRATLPAAVSPDERLAVVEGDGVTSVLSIPGRATVATLEARFSPAWVTFARDAASFSIRAAEAELLDPTGPAALVDAHAGAPYVRFEATEPGRGERLTPDGLSLFRVEGAEVARYTLPGGGREVVGALPTGLAGTHLLTSPDGDAVLALLPQSPSSARDACPTFGCRAYLLSGGDPVEIEGLVWAAAVSRTADRAALLVEAGAGIYDLTLLDLKTGALTPVSGGGGLYYPSRVEVEGAVVAVDAGAARVLDATTGALAEEPGGWGALWATADGGALVEGSCAGGAGCDLLRVYPDLGVTRRIPRGADAPRFGRFDDRTVTWDPQDDATLSLVHRDDATGAAVDAEPVSRAEPQVRVPPLYDDARAFGAPCLLFALPSAGGWDLRCRY